MISPLLFNKNQLPYFWFKAKLVHWVLYMTLLRNGTLHSHLCWVFLIICFRFVCLELGDIPTTILMERNKWKVYINNKNVIYRFSLYSLHKNHRGVITVHQNMLQRYWYKGFLKWKYFSPHDTYTNPIWLAFFFFFFFKDIMVSNGFEVWRWNRAGIHVNKNRGEWALIGCKPDLSLLFPC